MHTRAFLLSLALAAAPAAADVLYNEFLQGDLSDNRLAPTAFVLGPGQSTLFGVMEGEYPDNTFDRDYFSVTVPAGYVLSGLLLEAYVSDDFAAFIGIQPGPIFPNDPDTVLPGDLLGWALFGPQTVGQDLLTNMGQNGQGFDLPLPAGTYTFWAQQIGPYTEWVATFQVDVPSPGAATVLGLGVLGALRRRR